MAACFATGMLTACHNGHLSYEEGDGIKENDVYFVANEENQIKLDLDGGSFTVNVYRGASGSELTVPIYVETLTDDAASSFFSFESEVHFGEKDVVAPLKVDYASKEESGLDYDTYVSFLLTVPEIYRSAYGVAEFEIDPYYPSPWTSLGVGTYIDDAWWISDDSTTIKVEFFQNDIDPTLFRVSNPYVAFTGSKDYFQFRVLQKGETYLGQMVPTTGLVGFDDFHIDYDAEEEADVYLLHPGRIPNTGSPEKWVFNYVADFQDNGLPGKVVISPWYYMFGVGGYNYTTSEAITMIFPGFTAADTDVSLSYSGLLTAPDGSITALASVDLGADVSEAQVALVSGSDVNAAISAIENGQIETTTVTSSGPVNLPFDISNPGGKYTIVVVAFAGGEAVSYDYVTFTYAGNKSETWSLVATGLYTYLPFWAQVGLEAEVLELYESDAKPGEYKITHWFNDVDFKFTMSDSGQILVADQETGFVNQGSMIYVDDLVDYTNGTQMGTSFYEDGAFNFNVIYYIEGGYFCYGYETFVPSTDADALKARANGLAKGKKLNANASSIKVKNLKLKDSIVRGGIQRLSTERVRKSFFIK